MTWRVRYLIRRCLVCSRIGFSDLDFGFESGFVLEEGEVNRSTSLQGIRLVFVYSIWTEANRTGIPNINKTNKRTS
jgi:hypothetical protein